jgi:uncharacterized membrane protein
MKKLWFKAKKYGWGWYPSSWQGVVILLVYISYMVYRTLALNKLFDTGSSFAFRFFFEMIIPTFVLIVICYCTGEKPRWQWGDHHTE